MSEAGAGVLTVTDRRGFRSYHRLYRYPRQQRPILLVILVATLLSSFLAVLQPLAFQLLVDNGINGADVTGLPRRLFDTFGISDSSRSLVAVAAIMSLTTALLFAASSAALGLLWERAGQRIVTDLMGDVHARLLRFPLGFHARQPIGDSMSRLQWDSQSLYFAVSGVLMTPFVSVITILMIVIAAWRISPTLTVVVVLAAPVLALTAVILGPILRDRSRSSREAQADVTSLVTQIVQTLPTVQAFNAQDRNMASFRTLSRSTVSRVRRETYTAALSQSLTLIIGSAGSALVLIVGGRQVLDGQLSIGALLVFTAYARRLENQAQTLMEVHQGLRTAQAGLDRVLDILEAPDDLPERESPVLVPAIDGGARVAFEHVTFGYESDVAVLDDVDLIIEPGETVALVGQTGAGKSTLASLIPRFADPWHGRITLNGIDLRDASVNDVREHVSVVRQDPILLPVSVTANIAYGRPSADREDIINAATDAQALEFIERMPNGFDTVLGERGATLSGGQRQRIAIARALLKNAPVLILDEPTSALDAESEAAVIAALDRVARDRTVIVIAHRLSTVRRADRIIVMDQGRIVETGTHDELLTLHGHYARYHHLHFDTVGT